MHNFEKSIEIAKKTLNYTEAKLDFYYIIAISLEEMNRNDEAEEYFKKYLSHYKKEKESGYAQDLLISEFSYSLKDEILERYILHLNKKQNYRDVYKYYLEIDNKNKKYLLEPIYLHSLLKLGKDDELKSHLKNHYLDDSELQIISDTIEKVEIESDNCDNIIINNFIGIDKKIDLLVNAVYLEKPSINVGKISINKFYNWKWKILNITEKKDERFIDRIKTLNSRDLFSYLSVMVTDYEWVKVIDDFCNKKFLTDNVIDLNFIVKAEQLLLFSNKISEYKYKSLVIRTFVNITNYISKVYNLKYIDSSSYNSLFSNYYIMWLKYGELIKGYSEDRVRFIKGLKDLVNEMPEFKTLLEFFTKEINGDSISKDMIKEKEKLLIISEGYISERKYEKALEILNELNSIFMYDSNIINMLGITQFYLKDNNNALINLAFSYEISPDNFDIVYNLAFVLNSVDKKEEAKKYYKKALDLATDEKMIREISEKI